MDHNERLIDSFCVGFIEDEEKKNSRQFSEMFRISWGRSKARF